MLRGLPGIAAAAAMLATVATARAQASAPLPSPVKQTLGIDLGLQTGYGLAYGRINDQLPGTLNEVISSFVPIAADANYRIDDQIAVGLMFQYAILGFRDTGQVCGRTSTCSGSVTTGAVQATLHAPVSWRFVPWLRFGAGYEWLRMDLRGDFMGAPADLRLRFRGWLFGLVQLGADYAVLSRVAVGPVVGFSFGRYDFGSDGGIPEMPLVYKRAHEWLMLGVRGVFHL